MWTYFKLGRRTRNIRKKRVSNATKTAYPRLMRQLRSHYCFDSVKATSVPERNGESTYGITVHRWILCICLGNATIEPNKIKSNAKLVSNSFEATDTVYQCTLDWLRLKLSKWKQREDHSIRRALEFIYKIEGIPIDRIFLGQWHSRYVWTSWSRVVMVLNGRLSTQVPRQSSVGLYHVVFT